MIVLYIVLGVLVVLGLAFVVMYNGLIAKSNMADNALSSIDVQLKKRYDLIPNLVEAVKGYAEHEHETLERVVALREQALRAANRSEEVRLNNQINRDLGRILLLSESYPDLKASGNFLHLQRSLVEIEEQISAARRAHNAAVTDLNNAVQMIPTNLVAQISGITTRELFEAAPLERSSSSVAL